jgi:Fe-Mn family superoxide dismutase
MPYTLPPLPYPVSALEPSIDARTMEIHHTKHHQAYIDKVNAALAGTPWAERPIEEVITRLEEIPAEKRSVVRNHGGGHANHSLFWTVMGPPAGSKPSGDLAKAIDVAFGSFERFQEEFSATALNRFGSGWAWLVTGHQFTAHSSQLEIMSTPNQDSPLMEGKTPILGLDVWEHAYYLTYQNRRPDYVKAFWKIVHWKEVERRYREALS